MRILLLGSKGMLGMEINKEFGNENHEVICKDKDDLDVTVFSEIWEEVVSTKPDVVINCSAYNLVDKIEENSEDFIIAKKLNAEAVENIAKICREQDILFIHYSSDYVFKGDNQKGYTEESAIDPVNKYGQTKAMGENVIRDNCEKYYIIRLSKLFGKPGGGVNCKKSFVDTMVWLATDGGKTHLDLVDEEKSCPTYAPDLARFTRELIESKKPYGIYHGANSGTCTWYELAGKVFEFKNIKVDTTPVSGDKFPRPAKRPEFSELINTKMPKQRSWEEALKEYLQN